MERYPENIRIGKQDFMASGWKTVAETIAWKRGGTGWEAYSSSARKAIESGNLPEGKIFWILADACSMMLRPESNNEPFGPMMVMDGKRSAIASDFDEEAILFMSEIVEEIDLPWLKARIADIVWLLKKPRDPKFALAAIDSYRSAPITLEVWVSGGKECWERAIRLAITLKEFSGERIKSIESDLLKALRETSIEDGFLGIWISGFLKRYGFGKNHEDTVLSRLDQLSLDAEARGEFRIAREFLEHACGWYQKIDDKEKVLEVSVRAAETWVKEAHSRSEPMVKASFLEKAIHKYRTIPRRHRAQFGIDEKLADLHNQMNFQSKESLNSLTTVSSPGIDLSDPIIKARESVKGKKAGDALLALANIHQGARVEKIREYVISSLNEFVFSALISSTHYSRDGRVVAKRPGIDPTNMDSENSKKTIAAEMVRHYSLEIGIYVQACIWPALQVIQSEHRLTEQDFTSLADQSPIVPPGREALFGKGLFAGFDRDFVTALHILIPQIENLVRWHLKANGVKTTTIDADGIENEIGLSSLMEIQAAKSIFGDDISFELEALFCNAYGPNLRNELAHGLLEDSSFESVNAIYAWWMTLRIVFNTFWNERNRNRVNKESEENSQQDKGGGGIKT